MDSERWQRVAHIYEAALERQPDERGEFLVAASGGDDEVRREVESLLAQDSIPILLDRPMLEAAAAVLGDEVPQLAVGDQFGPYTIEGFLGAGGMGEVYRATDTRLDRTVAIKILPSAIAADAPSRGRFQREAKAIAGLTHPRVCTLHDIGHQDGIDFLVMEYVEGETLAARLEKGCLPVEDALRYSVEIADGLAAAHRHGIVHRDLKPGNIILSKGGAKLLDFGLAKSITSLGASPPVTSPNLTAQGTIIGTFQYMAPEQLEGREADARTDVFAFGAVAYEMLTGRKAFEGKTQASLIGAIMHADPPAITAVRPLTPAALDRIVRTCLAKDPDDRWQTARDLSRELRWVGQEAPQTPLVPRPATRNAASMAMAVMAAAALTGLAIWGLSARPPAPDAVTRFSFTLPEDVRLGRPNRQVMALSPDGSRIAIAANNQLYIRAMAAEAFQPIPGTDQDVGLPFFSPDGRWVAFWASARGGVEGALKKIPILGGAADVICETRFPFGASWAIDDRILLGGGPEGILRVSAGGGKPEVIVTVGPGELATNPHMLPDGKTVLFTVGKQGTEVDLNRQRNWDAAQVVVHSLDSGARKVLMTGTDARYSPTGHIVYALGGTLWARRFDVSRLEMVGDPAAVVAGVSGDRSGRFTAGASHYSFAANGTIAYLPGGRQEATPPRTLALVDLSGKVTPLDVPAGPYHSPRFSLPDGKQITLYTSDGVIWIYDLSGTRAIRQLTLEGGYLFPMWTHDGRIVYRSTVEGRTGIFAQRADGGAVAERLTEAQRPSYFPYSISGDGKTLFLLTERGEFDQAGTLGQGIVTLSLNGDTTPTVLFRGDRGDVMFSPTLSPDRRWLAYEWRRDNRNNIYVDPFPPTGAHRQVTTAGGSTPMWSPDGRRLFYVRQPAPGESRSAFYAVDVLQSDTSFDVGRTTELFSLDGHFFAGSGPGNVADLSPDGKQFVTLLLPPRTERAAEPAQVKVVLNWFAELAERVPAN